MANKQVEFWSNVANKYDCVVDQQIGGKTRSMVRERVAREQNLGRLVEFGCGTGFYTEVLARKADSLLATDISPGMIAIAKQRVNADRSLCATSASSVSLWLTDLQPKFTTETQRTQRLHREITVQRTFRQSQSKTYPIAVLIALVL